VSSLGQSLRARVLPQRVSILKSNGHLEKYKPKKEKVFLMLRVFLS